MIRLRVRPVALLLLLLLHIIATPGLAEPVCDANCIETALTGAEQLIDDGEYQRSADLLASLSARVQDPLDRARLLLALGWARAMRGAAQEALATLQEAERLLGPEGDGQLLSTLAYRLGLIHRDRGEYNEAEQRLRQALRLAGELEDPRREAIALDGLAGVAYFRADFAVAAAYYGRALETLRGSGASARDVSIALNNLAAVHFELGDFARAESLYREALGIRRATLDAHHPLIISALVNLGSVFEARADSDAAERLYASALALVKDDALEAAALDALGRVRRLQGRLPEALNLHRQALGLREGLLAQTDPYLAESRNHIAETLLALERAGQASAHWIASLQISESAGEPPLIVDAYHGLAQVLARQQKQAAAVILGKLAVAEVQAVRSRLQPLPEDLQRGYASRREPVFRALAAVLIDAGRLPEADAVLDLVRNEELYQFSRGEWVTRSRDAVPLSEEEAALAGDFLSARAVLREAPADLAAAQQAYGAALRRLIEQAGEPSPPPREQAGARSGSPVPGSVDLRYVVDPAGVRVLVTLSDRAFQRLVEVSPTALNQRVFDFRRRLLDPAQDPRPAALALYRLLLRPVMDELQRARVTHLQLTLDGAMRYVPFAALFDGERFIVERFSVARTSYGERAAAMRLTLPDERVVAFGVTEVPAGLPPLPYVREELETIVRRDDSDPDGAMPGEIYLDDAFSLPALERSGRRVANLHIASHFVFSPARVGDSFLVAGDGERVSLAQFAQLDLQGVRWLALSACETGLGVTAQGRGVEIEGLGALARARGAGTVLASLWRVSDRATSTFMRRLYRERAAGADGSAALRAAQLDALHGDRRNTAGPADFDDPRAPYAHPYFWSAFVLMTP